MSIGDVVYKRHIQTIYVLPERTDAELMREILDIVHCETQAALVDIVRNPKIENSRGYIECTVIIYYLIETV